MARNRFRSTVSRGTSQRRKFIWARTAANLTVLGVSPGVAFTNALADFETAYGADLLGATVMRVRGAVNINQSATMGMRVVTESFIANTDADNGPINDPGADWFLYKPLFVQTGGTTVQYEIDVKASRKLEELGQGLLLVFQSKSGTAGTVSYDLSIGLKLP